MINFRNEIAKTIANATNIDINEIEEYVEVPKTKENGDYAFPCFRLAKALKKAPNTIAIEIKNKIEINSKIITKVEDVNGYLNFFTDKDIKTKEVLSEFSNNSEYRKIKFR